MERIYIKPEIEIVVLASKFMEDGENSGVAENPMGKDNYWFDDPEANKEEASILKKRDLWDE